MIHFDAKKTFCKNIFKRKQIIHNTHAHTQKKTDDDLHKFEKCLRKGSNCYQHIFNPFQHST